MGSESSRCGGAVPPRSGQDIEPLAWNRQALFPAIDVPARGMQAYGRVDTMQANRPLNLVFLPATEPDDKTYGATPEQLTLAPEAMLRQVRYPHMVWYNQAVCREAMTQIRAFHLAPIILVGFSKSGLGAWNLARSLPGLVAGTIIFDAPVARDALPPWGTAPFYRDDADWQVDLPLRTVGSFQAMVPQTHTLVLISGVNFHDEMCTLAETLSGTSIKYCFLPRPQLRHHWQSGWLEEGLKVMLAR